MQGTALPVLNQGNGIRGMDLRLDGSNEIEVFYSISGQSNIFQRQLFNSNDPLNSCSNIGFFKEAIRLLPDAAGGDARFLVARRNDIVLGTYDTTLNQCEHGAASKPQPGRAEHGQLYLPLWT